MSNVIDEKIVKMTFDNSGFDSRIKSSMASLTMFKKELNLDGAASGAESSLNKLSKTANSIDMYSLMDSIQTVGKRFTTMGLIGMNVINQLSSAAINLGVKLLKAVPSQIASGGWARASNVAQAKFQLEGLGIAWENVADDIDHAVQDTSYGADAAAKAASQLAASGVAYGGVIETLADGTKVYSDMGRALRGISGTAAMTNSSYEEIADIFTTVAGQGKLMTMQLNQLAGRGLNVAATLADQWGKTEAEVREMVSKGKVQFQDFADAMDSAFGEHATKANETLSGSLSNMKAALSRIGQDFAQTILSDTPRMFNALKGFFNQIRKYTKPFADNIFTPIFRSNLIEITNFINDMTSKLPKLDSGSSTLKTYNRLLNSSSNILNGLVKIAKNVAYAFKPIGEGFKSVFSAPSIDKIQNFSNKFLNFSNRLKLSDDAFDRLKRTFAGIFSIFDIFGTFISRTLSALSPLIGGFSSLSDSFLTVTASVGDTIVEFDKFIKETDMFDNMFNKISEIAQKVADVFGNIRNEISSVLKLDTSKVGGAANSFRDLLGRISALVQKTFPLIGAVFQMIARVGAEAFSKLSNVISTFISGASFTDLINLINGIMLGDLIYVVHNIIKAFVDFTKTIAKTKTDVLSPVFAVSKVFTQLKETLIVLQGQIKADIIRSISISVAILTASLIALSYVDFDKIATGMAAIGAMLAVLIFALKSVISTTNAFTQIANDESKGFFGFIKNLGRGFTGLLDVFKEREKIIAIGMILMELSLSILVLAGAMKIISTIPVDQMTRSVIVVVGLILTLVTVLYSVNKLNKEMPKLAAILLSFSLSVMILAKALKMVAEIDAAALQRSVEALGLMMAEFGILVTFMSVVGKQLKVGDALTVLAFATSVLILSVALKKIGDMSSEQLTNGLVGVGGLLLELSLSMVLLGKAAPFAILGSAALLIMAAALFAIIPSFTAFAKMPLKEIGAGLAKIAIVVVTLGLLSKVLGVFSGFAIAGAIALTAIGVALIALSAGMAALSKIKFVPLLEGLASFSVMIVTMTLLAIPISAFIVPLLAFAGALAVLAVSMLAITAVTGLFIAEFASITKFIEEKAPELGNIIGNLIVAICNTIVEYILNHAKEIFLALAEVISGVAGVIEDAVDILLPALNDLIESIFYAIGVAISDLPEVIKSAIRGLGRGLGCDDAWMQAGEEMIDALWQGLNEPAPWEKLGSDLGRRVREVAKNLIDGFAQAIRGGKGEITSASGELGKSAVTSLNKSIDAHSPSRESEKSGTWFVEGFVKGLKNGYGLSDEAARKLGDNAIKGLEESLRDTSKVSKTVNNLKADIASAFAKKVGYSLDITNPKAVEKVYNLAIQYQEQLAQASEVSKQAAKSAIAQEAAERERLLKAQEAELINAASRKATEESVHKAFIANFEKRRGSYEEYVKTVEDGTKKAAFKEKQMNADLDKSYNDSYSKRLAYMQDYLKKMGASEDVIQSDAVKRIAKDKELIEDRSEMLNKAADAYLASKRTEARYLKELDEKNSAKYQNEKVLTDFAIEHNLKMTETKVQNNELIIRSEKELQELSRQRSKEEAEQANLQIKKQTQKMEIAKTASAMDKKFYEQRYVSEKKSVEMTEKGIKELKNFDMAEKKAMKSAAQATETLEKQNKVLSETEKAARAAKKEMEAFADSISKDLESKTGGMNFFNKLELKAETSAATILENMKSNVDGVASWTARLGQLMDKGLNKELVKTLADAGLDSYDQISAFLQMTDEQINQANELFLKAAEGRAYAANTISQKYYTLGQDNMQGMIDGISSKEKAVSDQAVEVAENAHKNVETLEGHASPSKWWIQLGTDNMQGLDIGMLKGAETYVYPNITFIINKIHRIFNEQMNGQSSEIYNIGLNFSKGLSRGILAGEGEILDATKKITSLIPKESKATLEEKSPSKLAFRIGRFFDMGLINGLTDLQNELKMTSKDVASSAVDPMQEAFDNASDFIGKNINVNPVIKPILDISNIASGMSEVSSMFDAGQAVKVNAMENSWSNPTVRDSFLDTFANRIGMEYADRVVDAINNKDMDANVHLEGDAEAIFNVVRKGNRAFMRRTGYSGI